jgi:predicted SprT family Zn-dependent metalloprotease
MNVEVEVFSAVVGWEQFHLHIYFDYERRRHPGRRNS